MSTGHYNMAAELAPAPSPRRWWGPITMALVAAIFLEAVFAGAMLSGAGWARRAHVLAAVILIASTALAGIIAAISLRRVPHGFRLGLTLLALGATVFAQMAIGRATAQGANLMWLHIPLGVALVGFAGHAAGLARRLG